MIEDLTVDSVPVRSQGFLKGEAVVKDTLLLASMLK